MATFYDKLEVSEKASKEIIEKAYRVLAKKYHPDLHPEQDEQLSKQKMQEINEAYEVLADDTKRRQYDMQLQENRRIQEQKRQQEQMQKINRQSYQQNPQPNVARQSSPQYVAPNPQSQYQQQRPLTKEELREAQRQQRQAQREYIHQYNAQLRNLKMKWSLKRLRDFVITISVMIGIALFIWFFPPTHKMVMDFYEDNIVLKTIVTMVQGGK